MSGTTKKPTRLDLGPNEQAVLAAASRIYAARIAAGAVSADNEQAEQHAAVLAATRLAVQSEFAVSEGEEVFDDRQDMGGGISILR